MRYVPVHELGPRAHVMIDGAARQGTAVTLSHWPRSSTPPALRRDLSSQIVLAALRTGYLESSGVDVATIDHYDEDGVIALAFAIVPGLAEQHSEELVGAAAVGDFGVVVDRRAALIAFALAALSDASRTPLQSVRAYEHEKAKHLEICGLATRHVLAMIAELADDPSRFESLWRDEAAAFDESCRAIGHWVSIEEVPEQDLAIVRVAPGSSGEGAARWGGHVVHPAAVNTATDRLRIATVAGSGMELRYRYESWVRMESYRPRPRVDLSRLASVLSRLEPTGVSWSFEGAGAPRPVMKTVGGVPSGIPAEVFVSEVVRHLAELDSGAPAWDPYV